MKLNKWPSSSKNHLRYLKNAGFLREEGSGVDARFYIADNIFLMAYSVTHQEWREFLRKNRQRINDDLVSEFIALQTEKVKWIRSR